MIDIGKYNVDPERYQQLMDELYENYPPITLPPEYAQFIQENLLRLLIRLARYKFVARIIKKTDRLLEVGCGSGLGSIFLSQHCAHVTGLDVKTSELEEARSINRRQNVDFVLADLFEMNTSSDYDVVVAQDVIEHMQPEEGSKLVAAMHGQSPCSASLGKRRPDCRIDRWRSRQSPTRHLFESKCNE